MSEEDVQALVVDNGSGMCKVSKKNFWMGNDRVEIYFTFQISCSKLFYVDTHPPDTSKKIIHDDANLS
jgi:hypothetical protein